MLNWFVGLILTSFRAFLQIRIPVLSLSGSSFVSQRSRCLSLLSLSFFFELLWNPITIADFLLSGPRFFGYRSHSALLLHHTTTTKLLLRLLLLSTKPLSLLLLLGGLPSHYLLEIHPFFFVVLSVFSSSLLR